MNRRSLLASLLVAPSLLAEEAPPVDASLFGDSLAYQLAPRLRAVAQQKDRRFYADGRGGSSTRQWRQRGWFRRGLEHHPATIVLVSLGVNCTHVERPKLADDIKALVELCPFELLWLLPPPLKMSTDYLRDAVAKVGCPAFDPGVLPLGDGIHPTDAGYKQWAAMLAEHLLWPS